MTQKWIISVTALCGALLACNLPAGDQVEVFSIPITQPNTSPDASPEIAQQTPTVEQLTSSADCPVPGPDTSLHVSEAGGYCFLYPASFEPSEYETSPDAGYYQPVDLPEDFVGDFLTASVTVNVLGAPNKVTSPTPEELMLERFAAFGAEFDLTYDPLTLGGQPGVVTTDLPGYGTLWTALVQANNTMYEVIVMPGDEVQPGDGEPFVTAQRARELLSESLTFFPPDGSLNLVSAEEVCPQADAGRQMHINRFAGYCLLLPESFQPDPMLIDAYRSQTTIEGLPDFMEPYPSITIGYAGNVSTQTAQTPMDIALERQAIQTDPSLHIIEESTIAGQPAAVVIDSSGPLTHRVGYVVTERGEFYTILTQPVDFTLYPTAEADIEQVWASAIETIAFFEPWN